MNTCSKGHMSSHYLSVISWDINQGVAAKNVICGVSGLCLADVDIFYIRTSQCRFVVDLMHVDLMM